MEELTLLELHLHSHGDVSVGGSEPDEDAAEAETTDGSRALPWLAGVVVGLTAAALAWRVLDGE